jgi:hypothetical protein
VTSVRHSAPAHGAATPVTEAFAAAMAQAVRQPPPDAATGLLGFHLARPQRSEVLELIDRALPAPDVALRIGVCLSPARVGAAAAAAAVVAGAETGASADALVAAFAVACEVELRISLALGNAAAGWDAACAVGVVAAAVGASLVARADESTLGNAIGIAGAQVLGRSALRDSTAGAFFLGKAAANGYRAYLLASKGFTGPRGIFDAERGYLHLLCDRPNLSRLRFEPGERWLLAELEPPEAAFEPVPAQQLLARVLGAIG